MKITIQEVIYTKTFWLKDKAEAFIEKHKKQDCFELKFKNLRWEVKKWKPIKIVDID